VAPSSHQASTSEIRKRTVPPIRWKGIPLALQRSTVRLETSKYSATRFWLTQLSRRGRGRNATTPSGNSCRLIEIAAVVFEVGQLLKKVV
jgi:hypothetical protein